MLELEERLRRLAGEHERAARVPPASATVRRGRRRRRRLAGAATALIVLSLVAGLAGVQELRAPAARELPATAPTAGPERTMGAPTTTAACQGSSCKRAQPGQLPRGYEPVEGTVVAEGTQPGYRWRLVIRRGKLPGDQDELVALFERDDLSPPVDLVTLEPVRLSFVVPTRRFPNMHGIVSDRTALVRLRIARDGNPVPPLEVRPTDGGTIFPHNAWFVAFLPKGTELYGIELLDRHGGTICAERIKQVKVSDGTETMPDGDCS
jgi:hypothetical protein